MSAAAAVARTDLRALLSELAGAASKRGRWHCIVPSHDDHDPSTTVFTDGHGTQRWRCWSCGHGGTAIDALVQARSMSVHEAITALEERTNTARSDVTAIGRSAPTTLTVPLSSAAHEYLSACHEALWKPGAEDARNWLRLRGLDDSVLRDNLVGFDPGPRRLSRAEGLPGNMSRPGRRPGLPGGTGVTFVSFDRDQNPCHVQCRLLNARSYKYANPRRGHGSIPPVSFPRTSITSGPLLVTEGVADGLIALTAGFRAATVTAATTLRPTTASQITRRADGEQIVLAFDNDPAGQQATRRLREQLAGNVVVLVLPAGNDLTDTYHQRPPWNQDNNSQLTSAR